MKHFEKKIKQDPDVLYGYEVPALLMYKAHPEVSL